MIRALAAICLLLALSAQAQGARDSPEVVVTLRDSGYMLGDLIDEHVGSGFRMLCASMRIRCRCPGGSRRGSRFATQSSDRAMRPVRRSSSSRIRFSPKRRRRRASRCRSSSLKALDGANVVPVIVPTQAFLLSPALPATLTDDDRELRPSPEPALLARSCDPSRRARRVAARADRSGLSALALRSAAVPALCARSSRATLATLAKTARWRPRVRREEPRCCATWHAALNHCAGETLYPSTLERLFQRAPFLAPLRERIETMFASSWNAFYAPATGASPPPASVLSLVRESADRERGVPC